MLSMPVVNKEEQMSLPFYFAASAVPTGRADGAVLLIPGKVQRMEEYITVEKFAGMLGVGIHQARIIALRELPCLQRRRGCKIRIPREAAERLARTPS